MTQGRLIFRPQFLLVPIILLIAFRPGDASWVNDEPIMMEMAIRYNHTPSHIYGIPLTFTPSPFGLLGTRGERYGPLPVWIDQIFLVFTHNLVYMVAARAVLFASITAAGLAWLAKTLRLSPWFAVITMLSPWVWLYGRSLWDSTWCIPISALLVAAYAAFLGERKTFQLIIAAVCGFLLPLIHLMGLAMVAPVLFHFLVFHRDKIRAWGWQIALALGLCCYFFWPYFYYVCITHFQPSTLSSGSPLLGWIFPLFGGHFLTLGVAGRAPATGWEDFISPSLRLTFEIAQWVSRCAVVMVWIGMVLGAARTISLVRRPGSAGIIDHLCFIAVGVWICQTVLDGIERVYDSPHYYSGTWIAYVFLAWLAVDWLRGRIGKNVLICLAAVYAAALALGIGIIATIIACNAGTRNFDYGTALSSQIAAARTLGHYSDDSVLQMQYPQWKKYPIALHVLLELNPPAPGPRLDRRLLIKYRDATSGDAGIDVIAQ